MSGAPGGEASASGLVRRGKSAAAAEASGRRPPGRCRVCGAGLVTGRERTLGRCLKCPGATDEGLAARLREWRDAEAQGLGLPASIVLTDETLAAVEERRPATDEDLRDIPGFRPDKISAYASQVLAIVAGSGASAGAPPTEETSQGEDVIDVRAMSDAHGDARGAGPAPPDDPAIG